MKVLKIVFWVALFLVIAFVSFLLYETQDEINATSENIDEVMNKLHNEKKIAGCAVSVFDADNVIYTKGLGYADLENKAPYNIGTQQYIASISKTTIGIALMKAEELGLLKIEDNISQHLPFEVNHPKFPEAKITLFQLATHTSSLEYNEAVVESLYVPDSIKSRSLEPFILNYFQDKTYGEVIFSDYAPGQNWSYSNIGSGLAAYIIEHKSGMTYADFTQKHIFGPLGMKNTYWFESEADSARQSKYYEADDKSISEVSTSGVQLYPCRDMITDVQDLTKYCQAIIRQDEKLLTKASFEKLLKPSIPSSVSNQGMDNNGLFFQIDRNEYGITYQLTGGTGGDNCINTMMYFDAETGLGYIFIGNTGASALNRSSHIWLYRALVSLGDSHTLNSPDNSFSEKLSHRWHNWYNRVRAFF